MEPEDLARAVEQAVRRCRRAGFLHADAEDCVHDALVALLARQADTNAPPVTQVQAWLTVTAHRKLLDGLRRAGREQGALAHLQAGTSPEADPGEVVTDRATAAWLVRALERLPHDTRQVCLSVADGATAEQTAAQLGISRRTVHTHLARARRLLRHLAAGVLAALAAGTTKLLRPAATTAAPIAVAAAATTIALLPHPAPQHDPAAPPAVAVRAPSPEHRTPATGTTADQAHHTDPAQQGKPVPTPVAATTPAAVTPAPVTTAPVTTAPPTTSANPAGGPSPLELIPPHPPAPATHLDPPPDMPDVPTALGTTPLAEVTQTSDALVTAAGTGHETVDTAVPLG